jgi:E3 ubiquitin-protein ligase TRIP12
LKDEELDISPVEIDDALVIEDDDISDDEDDDHEDVCFLELLIFVF